jgi:uncharacterized protein (DUF2147 family)
MKKIIALVICLIVAAAVFAQADPVVGFWLSVDEKTDKVTAGWQIYIENGILYGKIVSLADEPRGTIAKDARENYRGFPLPGRVNQMQVAGPPWIFGLTRQAEGDWRGGNIIDPSDGNMYGCRITFRPAGSRAGNRTFQTDTLEMRGTIGPIGRSQFWRKSDEATASNLWPN